MDYDNLDILVRLEAFDDLICQETDEYKKTIMKDIYELIEGLLNEKVSR